MTHQATLEKMQQIKLIGRLLAFRQTMETPFAHNFTTDELSAHRVEAEWEERQNRKLARLLNNANSRYKASSEQIDFSQPRKLDKNLLLRLSDCQGPKQGGKRADYRRHWRGEKFYRLDPRPLSLSLRIQSALLQHPKAYQQTECR